MIYVSSSCVKAGTIGEAVRLLAGMGYIHIELSGGTAPYEGMADELEELKLKHGLQYICHNYFPPPPRPFVINIASLEQEVIQMSLAHLHNAIALSKRLGSTRFGFHAGFLIDIPVEQVGKSIAQQKLFNREKASEQFIGNFNLLKKEAGAVNLYLENNVVSAANLANYRGENPFFITDREGYEVFSNRMDFQLLLDLAHLKVSCHSLGRDLKKEADFFIDRTDYIHVSDNDGKTDNNRMFRKESDLAALLREHELKGKIFTLEVYSGKEDLAVSYKNLAELIDL